MANEFSKHSQLLEGQGEYNVLYNIVNGKIAPPAVNVADAVSIGDNTMSVFRRSLPSGFHAKMSSPVKTMDYLKRFVKIGERTVFDAESIFLRILSAAPIGADLLLSIVYLYLWLKSLGVCGGASRRLG